jgi:Family of unknown function (DUF7002)
MDVDLLTKTYPELYHMAELGSWQSIKERGLLSTSALLDLFEIDGETRHQIESEWRPRCVVIENPAYGKATIRDQKPLHRGANRFIVGMTPSEYYELLNHKTFFWARKERLVSLLGAVAYKGRSHDVLTIDSQRLVENHETEITLSPINSGAFFGSGKRGSFTFKKIKDYPFEEERKRRGKDAIVEVVVEYGVKDVERHTLKVEEWKENVPVRTIWART